MCPKRENLFKLLNILWCQVNFVKRQKIPRQYFHHMLFDWYCNVSVLSKDSWSSPIEREKGRNDAPLKVFVWGQIALTVDFASFLFWPDFRLSSCPWELKKWPCHSLEWLWLFLGTAISFSFNFHLFCIFVIRPMSDHGLALSIMLFNYLDLSKLLQGFL